MDFLAVRVQGKRKPRQDAKASALSKYTLEDVLKLKFDKRDIYRPGQTIEQWVRSEATRLKGYVTSPEVVKKAKDGGLLLKAHMVIVIGSRHILVWDMDSNGDLAKKPYLAEWPEVRG